MMVFLFHEFRGMGVEDDPGAFFRHAVTLEGHVIKVRLI